MDLEHETKSPHEPLETHVQEHPDSSHESHIVKDISAVSESIVTTKPRDVEVDFVDNNNGRNDESFSSSPSSSSSSDLLIDQIRKSVVHDDQSTIKSWKDDHDVETRDYESVEVEGSSKIEKERSVDAARQSPILVEAMESLEGYDPFRILSSVFQRDKYSTPMEWSIASNESLFSIHPGNSSFSRDHVVGLNDLSKSEELIEDLTLDEEIDRISIDAEEEEEVLVVEEEVADDVLNVEGSAETAIIEEDDDFNVREPKAVLLSISSSQSLLSEGSEASRLSFTFPILPGSMSSEPVKSEIDYIPAPDPQTPSPTKRSEPTSTSHWFPSLSMLSCCSCLWPCNCCSWPLNCCHRRYCCFCCCF